MQARTHRNDISFLMVGKTGVGKSATGNTIIGQKKFESKLSGTAVTKKCQRAYGDHHGRQTKVVDMPGLSDASLSREDDVLRIIGKAAEAVAETPDGYDAVLIVIKLDRFTLEDTQTIAYLKAIFGDLFIQQYAILVVTHSDLYDADENDGQTIEEWCSTQEGPLKNLINECCGRAVYFQNKTKEEEEDVRAQQLKKLFTMVDTLQSGKRYTPKVFEAFQSSRDRLSLEMKLPVYTHEKQRKIYKLYETLKHLQSGSSEIDVEKMEKLKKEADKLLRQVKTDDKGTGTLNGVVKMIQSAQEAINATINAQTHKTDLRLLKKAQEEVAESIRNFERMEKDQEKLMAACMASCTRNAMFVGIFVAVAGAIGLGAYTIPAYLAKGMCYKVIASGAISVGASSAGTVHALSSGEGLHTSSPKKDD